MKCHMHNHIIVIYIQYKFHEIPSIAYKVMATDALTFGFLLGTYNVRKKKKKKKKIAKKA